MTIQIRKFQEEDIGQVLVLCDEIREYHRDILDGYFLPQDDKMEKSILLDSMNNENMIFLVAIEDEIIKALLLAEKRTAIWLENPKIVNIVNFGVLQESKGKGIAKLLMNFFYEECKKENIQEIKLGVFNKNKIAMKFYEDFGFEAQEQRMSLKVK